MVRNAPSTGFSLLTLNTWKCDGDYSARLPLMASGIARLSPDIVFLQEVFDAPGTDYDTAAYIAECAEYHVTRVHSRRKMRGINGQSLDCSSGLAILTREAPKTHRVISLPSDDRDGERPALLVELSTPNGMLAPAMSWPTHALS